MTAFTKLESAVLDAFCARHPEFGHVLRDQLRDAIVTERRNSGAGFFTDFAVDRSRPALPAECPRVLSGVFAEVERFAGPILFLLFNEGGYLDCLEGAACGDSTDGIDLAVGADNDRNRLTPRLVAVFASR